MTKRERGVKTLLESLKNGKWHRKICRPGVTIGIVQASLDLKLVREKLLPMRNGSYPAEFRITKTGRMALNGKEFPSDFDISMAIHRMM